MTPLTPQQMRAFLTYLRDLNQQKVQDLHIASDEINEQIALLEETSDVLSQTYEAALAQLESTRRLLDALNKNEPTPVAYFVEGQAIVFDHDGKVSVFVATTIPAVPE